MRQSVRIRFWIEAGLAGATGLLLLMTLVWSHWVEELFDVDPDGGSGTLEWSIVAVLLVTSVSLSVAAHAEWRRRVAGEA